MRRAPLKPKTLSPRTKLLIPTLCANSPVARGHDGGLTCSSMPGSCQRSMLRVNTDRSMGGPQESPTGGKFPKQSFPGKPRGLKTSALPTSFFPASSLPLWRNSESNKKIREMSVMAKPGQWETRADSLSTVRAPQSASAPGAGLLWAGDRPERARPLLIWDHPAPKASFLGSD